MWTSLMTRILTGGQTFADHISIWLLFIFRCFVLRAQNDSARTSRQPSAICIHGLTIPVLHLTSRLYSCGHDALRNATCYRRLQHWEEHLLTWYLLWEITLIIDYCAIKGCKQQRDKHLRQFIIAWYGIALGTGNLRDHLQSPVEASWWPIFRWRGNHFKNVVVAAISENVVVATILENVVVTLNSEIPSWHEIIAPRPAPWYTFSSSGSSVYVLPPSPVTYLYDIYIKVAISWLQPSCRDAQAT